MSNLLRKPGDWAPSDGRADQINDERLRPSGMHFDSNNTLTAPLVQRPEAVVVILYYDEVEDTLGPTAFVPGARCISLGPAGSPEEHAQPSCTTWVCPTCTRLTVAVPD